MRTLVLTLFLLTYCFNVVLSQNFQKVDSIVKQYPSSFSSINSLSSRISNDFKSPQNQARAIFNWMANNVSYDINESGVLNHEFFGTYDQELHNKRFKLHLAKRVLNQKKAVCQGYASLFSEICDNLNISNKIVTGMGKTSIHGIGGKFDSNHAWNLIEIEGQSFLIDVTWGSGGTTNGKFVRKIKYRYFFTPPETLILNHYPDNYQNALLSSDISKKDFLNFPLYYNTSGPFKIISPNKTGGLKSSIIKIKIRATAPITRIGYYVNRHYTFVRDFIQEQQVVTFNVNLNDNNAKRLLIYVNGEALVGYKILK